ncbi:CocE/NonD family hydrolase [Nocardia sp. NPDC005745]|uniref:CocE/NonD family hydrolase n=1 Tax=Nocardia sp. NPDC005745 TaxID=3157061 RepID=UPI0033CCF31E
MRKPSLFSKFLQRSFKLPDPLTREVAVERDVRIPMRDGAVLLADRWVGAEGGDRLPTALIRGPYARRGLMAAQLARPLAERGFQVLLQSTRGTFGSDGQFDPLRNERLDGIDTIEWLCKQPWFGESVVLVGSSYQGYTQWAMADHAPSQVKAMIPAMTESTLGTNFLQADKFGLESVFGWGVLVEGQTRRLAMPRFLLGVRRRNRAHSVLPLANADQVALGRRSMIIQSFFNHDVTSPYWSVADHSDRVADVRVPASLVSGWFDVFLPGLLRDYSRLRESGTPARLTIGPWSHTSPEAIAAMLNEAVDFGSAHANNTTPADRDPVRIYVMGAERWRDLPEWPPHGYSEHPLYLQPGGRLDDTTSSAPAHDAYRYDPADPTPAVGGARMLPGIKAGRVNNTGLERRADVLTYTSEPMADDLEVIGEVSAQIWFRSSLPHADVFVRLCDVAPDGTSTNVCDGLVGLADADQLQCVAVALTATAYLFKRGHRVRVQVSSGAFPQYNRNLGTGEARATATTMQAADQRVHHGPDHRSAIMLPAGPAQLA